MLVLYSNANKKFAKLNRGKIMQAITLKNNLLQTGIFINNEYLDKYVNLIINPNNNLDQAIIREIHHIIPVSYYKHYSLDINNAASNLQELDIKNHVLAHYYLTLCSATDWFYYGNALCVSLLTKRKFADITEQWINEHLVEINKIKQYRLYLNSKLQQGHGIGEENANNKYSYDLCNQIKFLLTEGQTNKAIIQQLNVPEYLIKRIRSGIHWSCKEDKFSFSNNDTKELLKNKQIDSWLQTKPVCKNCGKELTIYIKSKLGDGCFCSKHCIASWSTKLNFLNHPDMKQKIIANRDYSGENNPNYGKKASAETKRKISEAIKNSEGCKKSKRFSGHTHSPESKLKTSKSIKNAHKKKPNWRNKK